MVQTFVIHLQNSTARAPLVDALRDRLPNAIVLDAVDGRLMEQSARDAVCKPSLHKPTYPFGMMPSEIGCFLSHRKAWTEIANSDAPYGFVAEDDVVLGPNFETARALAEAHANPTQLIRFPMHARETPEQVIAEQDGVTLFRPKVIGLTAALYILGRDAAQELLDRSQKFDRPVDTWLQMRWKTNVASLTLWPADIISAAPAHGGSTIQAKKSAWAEISRGWKRARYRSAIKKLSEKP
ncbi:MAG: glycosyltransferase family 25 protein [Aliishimia sp.]